MVGKLLRQLYGQAWEGPRPTWTANERGRRWYARLSPERKRERYQQQRARVVGEAG